MRKLWKKFKFHWDLDLLLRGNFVLHFFSPAGDRPAVSEPTESSVLAEFKWLNMTRRLGPV
jgi:hypothetical protein